MLSGVRIGHPAPNFLFEYAPGRQITFSKLAGRSATLVFLGRASEPGMETLRDLRQKTTSGNGQAALILAIVDEEKSSASSKGAREFEQGVTVVRDAGRRIAAAYGITVWPTTVSIDALGVVTAATYGNDGRRSPQ